jgi:hypothetical protein
MTTKPPLEIFLSCGRTYTKAQEDFVQALEAFLKSRNCHARTPGRNYQSIDQPVKAARDLIGQCDGMVVVAFERIRALSAIEMPDSPGAKPLPEERHPTVWNQVEAAMGYGQHVPMLIFVQTGLRRQAMLSDRFEWWAQEIDLSLNYLRSEGFSQAFDQWLERIEQRKPQPRRLNTDLGGLRLREFLGLLTPAQLWSILAACLGVLATVATVAYKLGGFFHKP